MARARHGRTTSRCSERRAQLGHGRRHVQDRLGRNVRRYRINPLSPPYRLLALPELAGGHVLDRHTDVISLPSIGVTVSPFNPQQHVAEMLHNAARALKVRFSECHFCTIERIPRGFR